MKIFESQSWWTNKGTDFLKPPGMLPKVKLGPLARVRGMIAYSDLVKHIKSVRLDAHDQRLFHMLGEISSDEDAMGRGMLSVIVVHKVGDMQPGPGFFELAKQLGRNTSNILECWVTEIHKVHAVWSKK